MRWAVIFLTLLLSIPPAVAEEGFVVRFSSEFKKPITSVAVMDFERDWVLNDILVGSVDNKIYGYDGNGSWLGEYGAPSSVYAVSGFDYGSKDSRLSGSLTSGLAGSWNNYVYAFWRPYFGHSFSEGIYIWKYDTGGDIYSIAAADLDENGYDDEVLVGIGGDGTTSTGKALALTTSGNEWWSYSTSAPVKAFSTVDIDRDGIQSDAVVAYGKTVVVLKTGDKTSNSSTASALWSYTASEDVVAVSYADFDNDGEYDDVLAGAGTALYAIDSQGKLLWQLDTNRSIRSITAANLNGDENLDHYLVGAGDKILAIRNTEVKGEILWRFSVGQNFKRHIAIDFDGDQIMDDLAIITDKGLIAYDRAEVYLPDFRVVKNVSSVNLTVGEAITVNLTIENLGSGIGKFVKISDEIPSGLALVGNSIPSSITPLAPRETKTLKYVLNSTINGTFELPAASVKYWDNYAINYTALSNSISLNISSIVANTFNETANVTSNQTIMSIINTSTINLNDTAIIQNLTTQNLTKNNETTASNISTNSTPVKLPNLTVTRTVSNDKLLAGKNFTVDVFIRNLGEGVATDVSCNNNPPEEFEFLEGDLECPKQINEGESIIISYSLRTPAINSTNTTFLFPSLIVTYKGLQSEELFKEIAEEIEIQIKQEKNGMDKKKLFIVGGGLVLLIFFLKKKGLDIKIMKIGRFKDFLKKLKSRKSKNDSKENGADPGIQKKLVELYLEHKKEGNPLTFEIVEREFNLSHSEVETLVKNIENKLGDK